jgi:hypothetical protein
VVWRARDHSVLLGVELDRGIGCWPGVVSSEAVTEVDPRER